MLQEVQKVRLTPVEQTPEVLAELDPLADAIRPDTGVADEDNALVAPATDRFDRLYRPEALDVPVLVARDGPIASLDPDTVGTLAPNRGERFIASRQPNPENLPFAVPGASVAEAAKPDIDRLDTNNLLPSVQVLSLIHI